MPYPCFFDEVRRIRVRDPLAAFLGAAEGGVIEYSYLDAVKLAGHSCPTVAGAWLMTAKALAALYPDELPERGGIRVGLRDDVAGGVAGVIAGVAGLVTGAAGPGGFKGIAGRHARNDLLEFNAPIRGILRFERVDNGRGIEADYHPQIVPGDPAMPGVMARAGAEDAQPAEARKFGEMWQARVRRILIDFADDPRLVTLA
jgi:hypothetical protein